MTTEVRSWLAGIGLGLCLTVGCSHQHQPVDDPSGDRLPTTTVPPTVFRSEGPQKTAIPVKTPAPVKTVSAASPMAAVPLPGATSVTGVPMPPPAAPVEVPPGVTPAFTPMVPGPLTPDLPPVPSPFPPMTLPPMTMPPTTPTPMSPTRVEKTTPTEVPGPEEASEPRPTTQKPLDPLVELMQCYRENRQTEANAILQKFDPARREMLQTIMPGLAKMAERRQEPPAPNELGTLLDQYDQLGLKLCSRACLTLDKVSFCRSIDGFGMYEPLAADHFFQAEGQGQSGELVQVYLELRHFASQIKGPYHETVLASTLEIRDFKHRVVWRRDRPARPSRSRTPRQDCFLNCHFEVPVIPPGEYILWIQVKDLTGVTSGEAPAHRIATRTLDFRVGTPGQPRVER